MHRHDQNFPQEALDKIDDFVNNLAVRDDPVRHAALIREVKIECLLATENSPYLEVRANTESTDDPTMPCLTFRAMFIGTFFAAAGSFVDTLFAFRQPPVYVGTSVGQLLACESMPALQIKAQTRSFRQVSCADLAGENLQPIRSQGVAQSRTV